MLLTFCSPNNHSHIAAALSALQPQPDRTFSGHTSISMFGDLHCGCSLWCYINHAQLAWFINHHHQRQLFSSLTLNQRPLLAGSQALPSEVAREVVLEAANYFFQTAKNLEAEEIGLGQVVLSLLPHDPEVQQQGLCLTALQELQDYGLHLLPVHYAQVRQMPFG